MEISINTQEIREAFNVSEETVGNIIDGVIKNIALSYVARLSRLAGEELKSTRSRYQKSIQVLDEGRFKGAILLSYEDPIVRMVEEGQSAFDEKNGFANSAKKHYKKDGGWWLTIPMHQGTPDAVGESDPFSSIMPDEVYKQVKNKPTDIPTSTGQRSSGLALSDIPAPFDIPKTRQAIEATPTNSRYEEYVNKTSIFAGLVKIQDSVTGQNTYMTFRRVSDKSDPNAWIHPGIEKHDLTGKAMTELESHLEEELQSATNDILNQLGITE